MKLTEAKKLIDKMAEKWPDQDVRIVLPISVIDYNSFKREMVDEIRDMGYFTHLEGSAHADVEVVVKERCDGNVGPARTETSPS